MVDGGDVHGPAKQVRFLPCAFVGVVVAPMGSSSLGKTALAGATALCH